MMASEEQFRALLESVKAALTPPAPAPVPEPAKPLHEMSRADADAAMTSFWTDYFVQADARRRPPPI